MTTPRKFSHGDYEITHCVDCGLAFFEPNPHLGWQATLSPMHMDHNIEIFRDALRHEVERDHYMVIVKTVHPNKVFMTCSKLHFPPTDGEVLSILMFARE